MARSTLFPYNRMIVSFILLSYLALNNADQCTKEPNTPAPCFDDSVYEIYDRVLFNQTFEKSGFLLIKKSEEVVFPPGGDSSNWFKLTAVKVSNLMPNDTQGTVTLTDGGVGHQNVTLLLESQRGEGYHFQVLIRGTDSPESLKTTRLNTLKPVNL